jgi:hypothetical protein
METEKLKITTESTENTEEKTEDLAKQLAESFD